MYVLGIGSDLIDIRRIEKTIERFGDRFLDRIYTELERKRSDGRLNRIESYAKRYAAKEACSKALGTGFARAPESFAVHLGDSECFVVSDAQDGRAASGFVWLTKNGGHESMAAAFIVLDRA